MNRSTIQNRMDMGDELNCENCGESVERLSESDNGICAKCKNSKVNFLPNENVNNIEMFDHIPINIPPPALEKGIGGEVALTTSGNKQDKYDVEFNLQLLF
jgi:hypothetical protein